MSHTITVDELQVAVEEAPVGAEARAPVLFIPGMFAGAWMFEEWQRLFAERGWTSYAVSLRGHDGSKPVAEPGRVSLADLTEDALAVAAFLAGKHGRKPVVVAHSMGGLFGQKVAEAGAAEALALLASAPPRGILGISGAVLGRLARHLGALLGSRPLALTLEDDVALALNRIPPEQRPALHARFGPESGRAARELALGGLAVDARPVTCPVVSITAADDHFVPARIGRAIARKYHAPHWHYPAHAHLMTREPGWERIALDIERWAAHVTHRASQPSRDDTLWGRLKENIGDLVELEFFDGYRVRAEIVSVDLAARQRFVYEPIETRVPGARARYSTASGEDVEWSPLVELVALQPLPDS